LYAESAAHTMPLSAALNVRCLTRFIAGAFVPGLPGSLGIAYGWRVKKEIEP
jgi:hypothetical protein